MPARIVIGGRIVVASPDTKAHDKRRQDELAAKGWGAIIDPDDPAFGPKRRARVVGGGPIAPPLAPMPAPEPPRPAPPPTFHDDALGVTFRIVAVLRLDEGWVTAATIGKWFDVQPHTVHHLARLTLLDAAMEPGSPTRRYRVRDTAKVQAEIARMRAERRAAMKEAGRPATPTGSAILSRMKLGRGSKAKKESETP